MTSTDVQHLMSSFENSCAAFTRKDIDGYLDDVHHEAWTFQGGSFMPVSTLRDAASAVLAVSERFAVTAWNGGVVVGDAGSVWGTFEYVTRNTDGVFTTSTGSFSAHHARVDGDWKVVFTHYTPHTTTV